MNVHSVVCTEDTEVSTQARLPPSRTQRIAGDPEIPQADVSVHSNHYKIFIYLIIRGRGYVWNKKKGTNLSLVRQKVMFRENQ